MPCRIWDYRPIFSAHPTPTSMFASSMLPHGLSGGLAEESFDVIDRRLRIPSDYISDVKKSLTSATFFMTEVGGIPPEGRPSRPCQSVVVRRHAGSH